MIELSRTSLSLYPLDFNPYSSQAEIELQIENCQQFLAVKENQNTFDADFFDCKRRISALYLNISELTQNHNTQLAEKYCKKASQHIKDICSHQLSSVDNVMTALLDMSAYRLYRVRKSWEQVMSISLHKELRFLTKGSCEIEKALRIQETTIALDQKEKYKNELAKMWMRLKDQLKSDFLDDDEDYHATGTMRLHSIRIESDEDKQRFFNALEMFSQDPEDLEPMNTLVSLAPERERQRLELNICKWVEPYPEFQINYIKNCSLPTISKVSFRIPALEKIKELVDQKLDLVRKKYEQAANTNDVLNEENSLISRSESLKQQVERAKTNEKKLREDWRKDLKNFLLPSIIFQRDKSHFWEELESIHQRHPECAIPFLHLLFYQTLLPLDTYRYVLKKSYMCDPYKTYMLSLAMLMNPKERYLPEDPSRIEARLNVLRAVYPKDLALSSDMENGPCLVLEHLNGVEPFRSLALQQLASGQIDESIHTLIEIKQFMIGVSFPHQYLALAWALKGDKSKAFKLLERSSICCLPRVSMRLLDSIREINPDIPEIPFSSLLLSLIDCITQDFDLSLTENLINQSTKSLQENKLEELPFIYFGIQWLITHTIPLEFEMYKNMWENLFILISRCADLNHRTADGVSDAWIAEHFSRTETPHHPTENPMSDMVEFQYTVSFPGISWGMVIEEEIPPFVFQNLQLTKHSIHLISANLTKKIHGFLLAIICKSHSKSLLEEEIKTLPDYPSLFVAQLQVGFSSPPHSHAHQCATRLLNLYLSKKPEQRPYTISEDILNWASWNKSYHLNGDSYSNPSLLTFLKKLNDNKSPQDVNIALIDVHRARKNLQERIAFDSSRSLPVDESCLYEIFERSQKLFGWRLEETFESWGNRLRNEEKIFHFGVFDDGDSQNESNTGHPSIEFSLTGGNALKAMRGLLQFWQRFHEHVSRKNEWIAQDGEESDTESHNSQSNLSSKWRPEVNAMTWREIIERNKPELYPSSLVQPKDFVSLVAKKHEHACEIKKLKREYEQLIKTIAKSKNKDSDVHSIIAATMHMNAEYLRSERTHSVYVPTKEQAEFVYRLILETTTERLIQQVCREKGHFGWAVTDANRALSVLLAALEPSKDHFHGPETHLTGHAPFHWHYNAYIYNASGKFINFHIYYDP